MALSAQQDAVSEKLKETVDKLVGDIQTNRQLANSISNTGKIYSFFSANDVIENYKRSFEQTFFYSNSDNVTYIQTSSNQTDNDKNYAFHVETTGSSYQVGTENFAYEPIAARQFDLVYGNKHGSGSIETNYYPYSKLIYKQLKQLCLLPEDDTFTFGLGSNSNSIYGILYSREFVYDGLSLTNYQLVLRELNGQLYSNSTYTGSNIQAKSSSFNVVSLIALNKDNDTVLSSAGKVFNLVSGSIAAGPYISGSDYHYYGLFYPNLGITILNADTLNEKLSFNTVTSSNAISDNTLKLFTSIKASLQLDGNINYDPQVKQPTATIVKSIKTASTNFYYVKVKNTEYNYSNNPSYTTGSLNTIKYNSFKANPVTYITTIGLYNDYYDLLAVAKISKPIKKSFNSEYLFKIKLDF
jgi:hypothetical protein